MWFTYINIVLFALTFLVKDRRYTEFVRTTSFYVFVGWVLVVLFYGYETVLRFYKNHLKKLGIQEVSVGNILAIDFVSHILPVVVIGLPVFKNKVIVTAATCVVVAWYIIYRNDIPELYYLPAEHQKYRDSIVATSTVIVMTILLLRN